MKRINQTIARMPIIGRTLLIIVRARFAFGYFSKPLFNLVMWLFTSKERDNFTYDLEVTNTRYLAALIASVAKIEYNEALKYIKEIAEDQEIRKHIADKIRNSDLRFMADAEARFGRRVGWYALVRALKPKNVVETGVDKGMGSCVITAALKMNHQEGHPGCYHGTDINPQAGYLFSGSYANFGSILYGDSIESLNKIDFKIDLFINDSDHSADYEAREYEMIASRLSDRAVILGDNSHCTDKLLEFSLKKNRQFLFFQEKPKDHWYPGAGIGISFPR